MTRPSRLVLARRLAETLVLAFLGGAALGLPGLPAGWLSGAVLATAAAALLKRPMYVPQFLSQTLFILSGVSIGSAVTPETIVRMMSWPASMALLAIAMSALTYSIAAYLHYLHKWDWMSGLFAAAPGAMSQALSLAADTSSDLRSIAIVQSVRILILAVAMPLLIAGLGLTGAPPPSLPTPPWRDIIGELSLLLIVSTLAAVLAYKVRLPGGLMVGAMVGSGALHGFSLVHINLPPVILTAVFAGLGALIGSRFYGTDLVRLRELLRASFGGLFVGMGVATLFAGATAWLLSLSFADVLIAYAPGGLEAMTILAFALHLDPAFVGAHHLWRFFFVSMMMPVAVAYVMRWQQLSDEDKKKK